MAWAIRKVQIEWGDCDPAGIVFNPRYFEWFDAATAGILRQGGIDKTDLVTRWNIVIPVVETRAQFLMPSKWGDEVVIASRVAGFRRSSFAVEHVLRNAAGKICVIGNETRVCSTPDNSAGGRLKSAQIPPDVVTLFGQFRGDA